MIKSVKIYSTTDYKVFKKIQSNRDVNKGHLKKLVECIRLKNLLHLFPVVVNKQMDVIDGQHRIRAAEELGVAVYYVVDGSITKADIAMVNSTRKGWAVRDYIEFYAKEGKSVYVDILDLLNEYGVSIMTAARLIDRNCVRFTDGGSSYSRNAKSGNLVGGDRAIARAVCALSVKLKPDLDYYRDGFFLLDVKNAVRQSEADPDVACSVIYRKRSLFPRNKEFSYLRLCKDILGVPSSSGMSAAEVEEKLSKHIVERK